MSSCKTAIMSSKLFLASDSDKRKKILAALANPINIELVEQLDEYLDDEYQQVEPEGASEVTETEVTEKESDDTANAPEDSKAIRPSSPNKSLFEKHKDELTGDDEWDDDSTSGTSDSTEETTEEEPTKVENSTAPDANKQKIVAETTTLNPMVGIHNSLNQVAFEVKGLLNAKTDTAGVTRVNLKNDELWIYYNDDTNLNNVMTNVINSLNAASYQYLIFNRLARTDNAIVFTLSINDTEAVAKPIQNEE